MSKIPILDYAFLAFETDSSPKHVGGLQVFKLPKDAPDDFVAQLVARLTAREPEPPFDRRLHRPLLGMPEWRYAEDFDYSDHIFHEQVPEPHTLDALLERISILHAEKLDRTIPLWEIYFFEHLLPNRFALYFKVHHAYMDGISLSRVATAMLSDDPGDLREITLWNLQPRQLSATRRNAVQWLFGNARRAGRAAWALTALARVGFLHGLRGLGLSGRELPIPFTAPRTAFNSRLTRQRSVAVTRLPLSRLQWIADHVGVTVNDVLLELCDSAMSSYLDAHHARPRKPLVAQMPVSLERNGVVQGNQITIALIELGDDEDDPIKR
ncbi:MAG: wax ester/triacylglycerol synthase domain-containing protein, partial [Pseudomonadota bacterium]